MEGHFLWIHGRPLFEGTWKATVWGCTEWNSLMVCRIKLLEETEGKSLRGHRRKLFEGTWKETLWWNWRTDFSNRKCRTGLLVPVFVGVWCQRLCDIVWELCGVVWELFDIVWDLCGGVWELCGVIWELYYVVLVGRNVIHHCSGAETIYSCAGENDTLRRLEMAPNSIQNNPNIQLCFQSSLFLIIWNLDLEGDNLPYHPKRLEIFP